MNLNQREIIKVIRISWNNIVQCCSMICAWLWLFNVDLNLLISLCVKIEETDVNENYFVIDEKKTLSQMMKKIALFNEQRKNEWKILFIRSFIYSFIRLFIYSSADLFIYSSVSLSMYSSIHLFLYSSVHLFIYSFIDSNSESTLKKLTWIRVILS